MRQFFDRPRHKRGGPGVIVLRVIAIPMLALVAGCNSPNLPNQISGPITQPTSDPYPGSKIFPVGDVSLAQIYVTQANPSNSSQPYLKHICPDDFEQTQALKDIATKYSNAQGSALVDYTDKYTTSVKASVTGVPIHFITVGATYEPTATTIINYSGVKQYSVDDADIQTVWQKISDSCKKLIKKYSGFAVAQAVKASSINVEVTKSNDPNATAGLKVGNLSPGFEVGTNSDSDVTLSGKDLFFKVTEDNGR
jgi:hypothetical protein